MLWGIESKDELLLRIDTSPLTFSERYQAEGFAKVYGTPSTHTVVPLNEDGTRRTREQVMAEVSATYTAGLAQSAAMTPRQAAEAAHYAGGPSVDELEQRIRERRAQAGGVTSAA